MPVKRRTPKMRIGGEAPTAVWFLLGDGLYPTPADPSEVTQVKFFEEERLGEFWPMLREEILGNWIRENPGTRPAAWWRFDAPIGTDCPWPLSENWLWNHARPCGRRQARYLQRHGLLSPGEVMRLTAADFENETIECEEETTA